ncbi:hypothetical protein HII31_08121 [Pseudocercospora fuligena]|uniref:Uncharacterized protein n=1 Tax=Pseudocercospora fuligena TaxID=685502 RepID=A0A8H6VHR5_9PEZI|nr:hypothetical protein HII31_08121 [Pseudocercospora fuligena]
MAPTIPEARQKPPDNLTSHRCASTYWPSAYFIALQISENDVGWRRNTGREGLTWKLHFKSLRICCRKSSISALSLCSFLLHCAS